MDVLSLVANIIAVAGAAASVAKAVEFIRTSFKTAPIQLLQLLNEISDVRLVITIANDACRKMEAIEWNPTVFEQFNRLIRSIGKTLDELDRLILNRVVLNYPPGQNEKLQVSFKEFLKARKRIGELSHRLRKSRQELMETLTALTASQIPSMRVDLATFAFAAGGISASLENQRASAEKSVATDVSAFHPKLVQLPAQGTTAPGGIGEGTFAAVPDIAACTKVYQRVSCGEYCGCRCHAPLAVKSPKWITSFLGKLFIGYTGGSPLFRKRSCNEKLCTPRDSCVLTVTYWFPAWFLNRVLTVRDQWSPLSGHTIAIRTPRIRQEGVGTDAVFHACVSGNVKGMQTHFQTGFASPFDTHPESGASVLHMAIEMAQIEMCKFLIDQCADVYYEDFQNNSAIDRVWLFVLTDEGSQYTQALKQAFRNYLDIDEYVTRMGFSLVHRLVLGLAPKELNLKSYLQFTTANIDTKDSAGKTPLTWAATRGDADAVRTLISFGADLYLPDGNGFTPLHYASWFPSGTYDAFEELLYAFKNDVSQSPGYGVNIPGTIDSYGAAPLHLITIRHGTKGARLLLDNHAFMDCPDVNSVTAVSFAIEYHSHEILELLLDRGARIDIKDMQGCGILHYAASFASLQTLQVLIKANLMGISTQERDNEGRMPRDSFDSVRPMSLSEDHGTRELCREAFEGLLRDIDMRDEKKAAEDDGETALHEKG